MHNLSQLSVDKNNCIGILIVVDIYRSWTHSQQLMCTICTVINIIILCVVLLRYNHACNDEVLRCYELRCQTGVVAGNFSSDNTPVPYLIGPAQSQPPYQFTNFSGQPPLDDFNRSFPGNSLDARDVVFTQCWNLTDSLVWLLSVPVSVGLFRLLSKLR